MATFLDLILLLAYIVHINASPQLAQRSDDADTVSASASASATISASGPAYTWSPSQLVDVTGDHAYADPLPGQARGPCPAQNALANHGYLNRSGYTNFDECVAANGQVYNMFPDFAAFLCFLGQLTGGDLIGATWSIGNSSAFDPSIKAACPCNGLLGCILAPLVCYTSDILDKALGTAGFGMAQTHNCVGDLSHALGRLQDNEVSLQSVVPKQAYSIYSNIRTFTASSRQQLTLCILQQFEADSSILTPDWTTLYGLNAAQRDPAAVSGFFAKHLSDGTWDDPNIWIDWAYYRMNQGIQTNPCYFRTPQATLFASLGAYAFTFKLLSNHTQEKPGGTLNGDVLSSFFSFQNTSSGALRMKGLGREQIPTNWYKNPNPYNIVEFLTVDYPPYYQRHPELASLGGNTNGVNTFAGLDMGDLSGGVINGHNLLEGDNFVCFLNRALQVQLENKLPSVVGGALLTLGATLGDVLNVVMGKLTQNPAGLSACPTFTYKDIHSYTAYCGVRQQPGGML